ncbi:MAG: hypothetical protein E7664_00585 [Ruminococcaceae bacterium]|nr:hypothetical protein [Oscillospiraceae bacterium]
MNKRLLCLLLSVIMLLSVGLVGCKQKTDEELNQEITKKASESTVTLSMYLMCEKEVTDDQKEAIETAVNRITKSKFKAAIELHYFTADQYYAALKEAFQKTDDAKLAREEAAAALREAIKRGEATAAPTDTAETEAQTVVVDGVTELFYPAIDEHQVDIFYLGGYDNFFDFLADGRLAMLDDELSGESKQLKSYIPAELLSVSKEINGGVYGIPNNHAIGEYTYLLLNKEILSKYNYRAGDNFYKSDLFTSLTCDEVAELLSLVKRNENGYVPLNSMTGELDVLNVKYFGYNADASSTNAFSILGSTYDPMLTYKAKNQYYVAKNIFTDEGFKEEALKLAAYKEAGYYGTEADANKPFAVGYVKGGAELVEKYGDQYEMVAVQGPIMTTADLYSDMFCVSTSSSSVSRSMKIITYLNTNADFRNLILYGIEDENYKLVEKTGADGETYTVVRPTEDNTYFMSKAKTGNEMLTLPLESDPVYNLHDYEKQQNRSFSLALDLGFGLRMGSKGEKSVNRAMWEKVNAFSKTMFDEMMACDTTAEMTLFFEGRYAVDPNTGLPTDEYEIVPAAQRVGLLEEWFVLSSLDYSPENTLMYNPEKFGEGYGFHNLYRAWLTQMGIYQEDTGA